MKQLERLGLQLFVFALALLAHAGAIAQAFPSRPVKFVIGFATGGTPDVFARLISQKMTEAWGVPVLVENRPGATGNIAAEYVAKSPADGYTLFYCDSANWAINPWLFAKLPYDPFKDFAPVILTSILPTYMTVHPSMPVNTVAEFIAYAKQRPGKLAYATPGAGSIHHITTEVFRTSAGLDMVHVPYKGAAAGAQAVLAGDVQLGFLSYTAVSPHVTAGKLKILAVSTAQRSTALPNLPTLGESGVPGFDMASALGGLAPAGTPREVIAKLHSGIAAAIATPDLSAKFTGFGVINVANSTPESMGALMRAEYEKFGKVVKQSGAKLD